MADKKVMRRRSAPQRVEDEDGQVPARATGPSKKVAGPRAAPSKRPAPREAAPASRRVRDDDYDDDDDDRELRSGWSAAQETIDATSPWAATFVPGTEMQIVKFLEESPYASYQRHWIQRVGTGRRPYTCLESWGRPCPLCAVGDRAGAVAAFNVAVVGDDGEAVHKSWDCAVKVTQILKTFNKDPKIGPLTKPSLYFGVSVPETTQRQQKQTMVVPIRARDMLEDYRIAPLDDDVIQRLLRKAYTNDVITRPPIATLQEVADEITGEDISPDWSS